MISKLSTCKRTVRSSRKALQTQIQSDFCHSVGVNIFGKNLADRSITNVGALNKFELAPGVYVVGASCARKIKHCFIVRVYEDGQPRQAFDRRYDGGTDDEFYDEPLPNLTWLRTCNFIRRFERVGKVPRKWPVHKKTKTKQ